MQKELLPWVSRLARAPKATCNNLRWLLEHPPGRRVGQQALQDGFLPRLLLGVILYQSRGPCRGSKVQHSPGIPLASLQHPPGNMGSGGVTILGRTW